MSEITNDESNAITGGNYTAWCEGILISLGDFSICIGTMVRP
jgi:hypothetical protein